MSNGADKSMVTPPAGIAIAASPMLIAAAATVAIGAATGNRDLVRSGVRLAAVQVTATVLRAAVRRFDDAGTAAPPPLVVDAMAVWLAETAVGAALARFDPPVAAAAPKG